MKPKLMLFALIQKIILFDDKIEIYYNYIKNPYPDDFSPEIARDSSFIPCSIQFQSVAPDWTKSNIFVDASDKCVRLSLYLDDK